MDIGNALWTSTASTKPEKSSAEVRKAKSGVLQQPTEFSPTQQVNFENSVIFYLDAVFYLRLLTLLKQTESDMRSSWHNLKMREIVLRPHPILMKPHFEYHQRTCHNNKQLRYQERYGNGIVLLKCGNSIRKIVERGLCLPQALIYRISGVSVLPASFELTYNIR